MSAAHTIDTRRIYKRQLEKPDGRALYLYSRSPIEETTAPAPNDGAELARNPHVRWHPLRGEWIAYAGYRQHRTFLPPAEYDPLAPTRDPSHPTELPSGEYDVAVFENRFPTFYEGAHDPPKEIIETAPARGACEVVVYTKEAQGSLGALPLWNVEMIVDVWADRTLELGARDDIAYVFPFENRGVEVGVTLHHPHGQIYAYPFVPPIAERELGEMRAHYERTGKGLLASYVEAELADARRLVYAGPRCVAFIPACARWAYETWVVPLRPVARLPELSPNERADFARALKTVLMKLDGLFERPMPYVMALHQAPSDGGAHLEAHVHIEIYPALRMPNRIKYLAGSEIGAGVFTADTFPEDKADELRRVEVNVD
jgi:UDPglucose--hexose-1-phosphate uridylyltransferase